MESRFGVDFGRVRVHADAQAARLVRSVEAFTLGRDPVFDAGQFRRGPKRDENCCRTS